MAISQIAGGPKATEPVSEDRKRADERRPDRSHMGDRSAVSEDARTRFEAAESERIATLREKVAQGFYSRRDVILKAVEGIVKDIKGVFDK
jgi:hypothetical protein